MSKKKKSSDINVLAAQIVAEATQEQSTDNIQPQKNPAAVALGHLGGLKGGPARREKLSAKRRKKIAQNAAKARWKKKV